MRALQGGAGLQRHQPIPFLFQPVDKGQPDLVDGYPSILYIAGMDFDAALRRYRKGVFTDHNVTDCAGLSVRAWRELIKVGAVRTITPNRGRGRVRLCDRITFNRAAVIAALNRTGLSLAASGRIAYFLPFDRLIYDLCNPSTILFQVSARPDPDTGLPPRLAKPKADWFDPDKPAKADPKNDWLIEIYDGRFVGIIHSTKDKPWLFGDLRNDGSTFISWFPIHRHLSAQTGTIAHALLPHNFDNFFPKWENPIDLSDRLDPGFLDYHYEDHGADGDPLRIAAIAAAQSPILKTSINVTLAIRKALRRYLGIELAAPKSEMG